MPPPPILYLDALKVKVKSQGRVVNKSIYLAFGVTLDGLKEVLGIWAADTEGAKFWMQVITELKNRGVQDIFIACVDGLKGFPEAIEAIFPETQLQLCIVHLVRHSLFYVSHKDRKEVAQDLKLIYQAPTLEEADSQLSNLAANGAMLIRWSSGRGNRIGRGSFRCSHMRRKSAGQSTQPTRLNR